MNISTVVPKGTVEDAARALNRSTAFVYREVNRGRLGHTRIGRLIRFTEDDIEQYLEAGRRPASAGAA